MARSVFDSDIATIEAAIQYLPPLEETCLSLAAHVAGFFMRGNIGTRIFDTISTGPKRRLCGFTALSQKRFYV
jgi:hypothetical protein